MKKVKWLFQPYRSPQRGHRIPGCLKWYIIPYIRPQLRNHLSHNRASRHGDSCWWKHRNNTIEPLRRSTHLPILVYLQLSSYRECGITYKIIFEQSKLTSKNSGMTYWCFLLQVHPPWAVRAPDEHHSGYGGNPVPRNAWRGHFWTNTSGRHVQDVEVCISNISTPHQMDIAMIYWRQILMLPLDFPYVVDLP